MDLVRRAIRALRERHPIWTKNQYVFDSMDIKRRCWYWAHVQKQAKAGVPAMQALVTEVIKLRLKG